MKCRKIAVLAGTMLALTTAHAQSPNGGYHGKQLGAYFEEWSIYGAQYNISDVQSSGAGSRLTHLFYAFANVTTTPSPGCAIADAWADYQDPNLPPTGGIPDTGPLYGNFAELLKLKQLNPGLKVVISIGGASAANAAAFSTAASTATGRQQLVASCLDLFITGNLGGGVSAAGVFDGVDIDWESPTASDKTNYTALLTEFRTQLDALGKVNKEKYVLTAFGPAGSQNYLNQQLAAIAKQIDFFNLQGYDYHGSWEMTTNNEAPLYGIVLDPSYSEGFWVNATVKAYLKAGVPAKQIVLGIPFYGYGWAGVPSTQNGIYQPATGPAPTPPGDALATDGVATFRSLSALTSFTHYWQTQTKSQWIYSPASEIFWTFDDVETVKIKMGYVQQNGLGGAFGWALKDDDANADLVKTMSSGLADNGGN